MIRSRKECVGGAACEPSSIAEALHCLIEHSALDVAALAAELQQLELHASRAYLYELANPSRADRGVRVLAIASALTAVTRRSVLLRFLCRRHGGAYVELPPALASAAADDTRVAAETLREFAEAMQAFAAGAADQQWSVEEVERVEREGHDAIERILACIAHARRRALPATASRMAKAAPPARRAVDPWLASTRRAL